MVTGSDQGIPPLSSIVSVQVAVGDVNDNAPRFSQNVYTSSVPEFLATGASATQVRGLARYYGERLCMHKDGPSEDKGLDKSDISTQ